MAVLGFHVVVTLIAITLFTKLKQRYSLCEALIFKGLFYYLPPSAFELKEAVGKKFSEKRSRRRQDENEPFNVPKDVALRLLRLPLSSQPLSGVPFFTTLTFVVDYFVFAVLVFVTSETFIYFFPQNRDTNVSIVWLFIATFFMLRALAKLTATNVSSPELTAERNLVISFAGVSFLFCVIFVMSCDRYMDIHFQEGYHNFTRIVSNFLREQQISVISDYEAKSPVLLYIFLSLMLAVISSMSLFPSLRYATMYLGAIGESSIPTQALLHFTFMLPVFILALFTTPVRDLLLSDRFGILTPARLDALRIFLVVAWALLRFATARPHLQAYLNTAEAKIEALQREAGFIKSNELQRLVLRYAQYFCAAALQYLVPPLLTMVIALILKNLGDVDLVVLGDTLVDRPVLEEPPTSGNLRLLLNFNSQRAFWSFNLVVLLIINVVLSAFGAVYTANFIKGV